MEMSSVRWLSELEAEDPNFLHQCQMNSFDELTRQEIAAALGEDFQNSFSAESYSSYSAFNPQSSSMESSHTITERPAKQFKSDSWNSCTTEQKSTPEATSSSPKILSFGNPNSPSDPQHFYRNLVGTGKNKDDFRSPGKIPFSSSILISQDSYMPKSGQGNKRVVNTVTKSPSHTQDHIIAERKRREKLSQRFIALSAIVPGLKKMDKASVLGDAIKYLKQLQERVKILEEQTEKKTVESVIFVKKSQISTDDDISSTDENFAGHSDEPLPEIEARVSEKNILLRIHCENRKGVVMKTMAEIEKLHLTIVNSSIMPFGSSALDITIIAQMDVEFCLTVKDLMRNLRSAFREFM